MRDREIWGSSWRWTKPRESLRFKIIYMHTEAIKIMEKGKIDDAGERGGNSDYFGFLNEIGSHLISWEYAWGRKYWRFEEKGGDRKIFSRRLRGQEKMLLLSSSIKTSLENNDNHNMTRACWNHELEKFYQITVYAKQKETQMYRRDFWTLWEKARVGCSERTALKQVYYQGWNRSPAQVGCMRQVLRAPALGRPRGMGWGGRWERGSGWGTHVNP